MKENKFQESYACTNRLNLKIFSFIGFFLLASGIAFGETYFVSPYGNDTAAGTERMPWRTIQKCANTLNPGDFCVVKDGIYYEKILISRSGTASAPIFFVAANMHQAVIEGGVRITGSFVVLQGFKVVIPNDGRNGIATMGNNNQIINNYVTTESNTLGLNNEAMSIGGNYSLVSNNYVEKTCFGYGLTGSYHHFLNNEANRMMLHYQSANPTVATCGDVDYMRFFGVGHIISGNYFHGVRKEEIGKAHVDCFQTFDNGGIDYRVENILIENNFCSDAAQGMMVSSNLYQSRNLTVRNNIFTRCGAWCVCLFNIENVRFYNNTCDTTGGIHGIWCRGPYASCEFKNNIFYGTGTTYGAIENAKLIDGSADAPGKSNLLYNPQKLLSGYGNDIKNKDPLFIDPALGNYRLLPESPAIDAGVQIRGWENPTDKDGIQRPQGRGWDIGAYEYRATTVAPPRNLRPVQ